MIRTAKQCLSGQLVILAASLWYGPQALAQKGFPDITLGPAIGYEDGKIDDSGFQGLTAEVRLFKLFTTYPFTHIGVDARVGNVEIETPVSNIEAQRTAFSAFAGIMFPVDLFGIVKPEIPEGAGPPFYVGYNFSDKFTSDDERFTDLSGKGWKAGFQLPAGPFTVMQFEYTDTTYEAPDGSGADADDLHMKSWTYYFQALVPITTY